MNSIAFPVPGAALQRNLEYSVPLSAFGFTLLGILLWQSGIRIPIQYFAAGCVVSSCILAYLAFIRPHKDIVALSTPLYAFIFFVVPTEYESGVILQILYGISITILLVRLKYRFGDALPGPNCRPADGPLAEYIGKMVTLLPPPDPSTASEAAAVFVRFAEGEYALAAQYARRGQKILPDPASSPVAMAFAITEEQASHITERASLLEIRNRFIPDQQVYLFHAAVEGDKETVSETELDNALLLLYAVAVNSAAGGSLRISQAQHFAIRLAEKP